jgi:flagellar basal body P-ring formation protein FlgA
MMAKKIRIRVFALAWLASLMPLCAQEATKTAPTPPTTTAKGFESHASIQQRVIQFLKNHPGLAPESKLEVSLGDAPLNLPVCREISTYLPGNPLKVTGTTKVAVRCHAPSTWLVFVTAKILTLQRYWVWTEDLPSGSVITGQELSERTAWTENTPIGAESDLNFFIGKTIKQNASKGAIATSSMIKTVPVINAGQAVKITVNGNGFKISTDGKAQSSALPGQSVQVRMSTGQMVSGIASPDGSVEVWRP